MRLAKTRKQSNMKKKQSTTTNATSTSPSSNDGKSMKTSPSAVSDFGAASEFGDESIPNRDQAAE